jgi:transcriptional regulator with XRE-family HTH domain
VVDGTEVGRRIRAKRLALGVMQQDLAAKSGVDANQLWKIEDGRVANPRVTTLVKLAEALGCTVAELAGEEVATPLTPLQKWWLGLLDGLPDQAIPEAGAEIARLGARMAAGGTDKGSNFRHLDDALALGRLG